MRYIKFNEYLAEHIYELMLHTFQDGCYDCDMTKKKLENFLGKNIIRRTKKIVKKNPYC